MTTQFAFISTTRAAQTVGVVVRERETQQG